MHKKFVIAGFVIAIAAIATIVFLRYYRQNNDTMSNTKVSAENHSSRREESTGEMVSYGGDEPLTTLIPLENDETLVAVLNESLDGGSYHDEILDQIAAVKTSSESPITLLIGYYNPETESYGRDAEIQTDINQVSTFSYYTSDLTGSHKTCVIYEGINEAGLTELSVWHVRKIGDRAETEQIHKFESNDIIYIQETDRSYTYHMDTTDGSSYPVYVYSMEGDGRMKDQVVTVYLWDKDLQDFVVSDVKRTSAASLASRELSFVQGGSIESYANYLNGLWKLNVPGSKKEYYIFFDYDEKTIVFYCDDTQEIYEWGQNYLRYSGIYISTVNSEIANLRRRIDISLKGVDSIQVRLMDDVRMIISESTEWDGEYKKQDVKEYYNTNSLKKTEDYVQEYIRELEKGPSWRGSDGSVITFADGKYTSLATDGVESSGFYTKLQFLDMPFIQFRSPDNATWLNGTYLLSFAEIVGLNKNNSIILQPYRLSPDKAMVADERPLILNRIQDEENN